jgi:serine/threonine-protein kinase
MKPLSEADTVCPHCGYAVGKKNPAGYLAAEKVVGEHYIVGRALGSYGDACIYVGYDTILKSPVFIREYFPADFCERTKNGKAVPAAGKEAEFELCQKSFLANARALAKLRDLPAILPLYDIFSDNDTVYAIYDYCEMRSLSKELKKRGGRMNWQEIRPLFMQLMTTLSALHQAGVYHLAITPDTILIGEDGKLRLRSFAIPEARTSGSPIKPRLQAGFSAPEQYNAKKTVGASADVYGLAATIFTAITGNVPPEAPRRVHGSQDLFLPAEVAEQLPNSVGLALFNALQTDPDKRLPSIEAFRAAISAEPAVDALVNDAEEEMEKAEKAGQKNRYPLYIGIAVFVILAVLAGILLTVLFPAQPAVSDELPSTTTTTTATVTTTTTYVNPETLAAVPNLVGQDIYTVREKYKEDECKIEITFMQYDQKKEKGVILKQEPAAGESMKKGDTIQVIISAGSDKLTVPDVVGWPEKYATKYLEALGFRVDPVKVLVSEYEKGLIEAVEPAAGSEGAIGDLITLRVSDQEKADDVLSSIN